MQTLVGTQSLPDGLPNKESCTAVRVDKQNGEGVGPDVGDVLKIEGSLFGHFRRIDEVRQGCSSLT